MTNQAQEKILQFLVDLELEVPCDELAGSEECYKHCEYTCPQKECWRRWAELVDI